MADDFKARLHSEADAESLTVRVLDAHQQGTENRFHLMIETPTVQLLLCIPGGDSYPVGRTLEDAALALIRESPEVG